MNFNTIFITKSIVTLEKSFSLLEQKEQNSIEHNIYRYATIKEFMNFKEQLTNSNIPILMRTGLG